MTKPVPDKIQKVLERLLETTKVAQYLCQVEETPKHNNKHVIKAIVRIHTGILLKIIEEDVIDPIEKNGHGGGNWRRLVFQARSKLKGDDDGRPYK